MFVQCIGIGQCFAWIQNAVRVKLFFNGVHEVQAGLVQFFGDPVAFDQANAVFSRNCALQFKHGGEYIFEAGFGALFLAGSVRVIEQIDVQVTIAGVAKVDDLNGVFFRKYGKPVYQFRHPGYRNDDVFVYFFWCYATQRG